MKKKTEKTKKEKEFLDLLNKHRLFPQRFLVIAPKYSIYSYANRNFSKVGYGIMRASAFSSSEAFHDRGRILKDVIKIEFLLSQIMLAKLSERDIDFFDVDEMKRWNKFLDNFTFCKKIEFLSNFNLIKGKDRKILDKIRILRNQAAHSLDNKHFEYNNKIGNERASFLQFREDLEYIWKTLAKIYHDVWSVEEIFDHAIHLIKDKYGKK